MDLRRPLDAGLPTVLGALRRPGHEAQFTQVIAAVAGQDGVFASALANVLANAAPHRVAREALGPIPELTDEPAS
jgi:hypothetical protein